MTRSQHNKAGSNPARYAQLRTRWLLIALCVRILLITALVWVFPRFVHVGAPGVFLVWAVVYVVVRLPFEYYLTHGLRRRFGLAREAATAALRRAVTVVSYRAVFELLGLAALLVLLVYTGLHAIAIMTALWLAWSAGRYLLQTKPKSMFGCKVASTDNDRLEALRSFARRHNVRNIEIAVLSASNVGAEQRAGYLRRRGVGTIYLSDNMLDAMTPGELTGVFAHELGHHLHRDWTCQASGVAAFAATLAAGAIVPFLPRFGGISAEQAVLGAPAAILVLNVAALLLGPVLLLLSRRNERTVNKLALEMTGDPRSFISAMRKLARSNLLPSRAGLIDRLFTQTHPSLDEVIDQARRYAASNGIDLRQSVEQ